LLAEVTLFLRHEDTGVSVDHEQADFDFVDLRWSEGEIEQKKSE
jgi:hypothetical protein